MPEFVAEVANVAGGEFADKQVGDVQVELMSVDRWTEYLQPMSQSFLDFGPSGHGSVDQYLENSSSRS
ncbi:hypothetical protein V6N13_052188 [Hibiscus sabdariffa]